MTEIPFVKPDQIQTARNMEATLLNLPESLVTFVGVRVYPTLVDEEPQYEIMVGCPESADPAASSLAAFFEIRKQPEWKYVVINVKCFRGRTRNK